MDGLKLCHPHSEGERVAQRFRSSECETVGGCAWREPPCQQDEELVLWAAAYLRSNDGEAPLVFGCCCVPPRPAEKCDSFQLRNRNAIAARIILPRLRFGLHLYTAFAGCFPLDFLSFPSPPVFQVVKRTDWSPHRRVLCAFRVCRSTFFTKKGSCLLL